MMRGGRARAGTALRRLWYFAGMRLTVRGWLLFPLVLLAGCGSPAQPDVSIPIVRVRSETFSGLTQPAQLIIRDQSAWQQTWSAIWTSTTPAPGLPVVDFSSNMIIVVAAGSKPSSGYAIAVESASQHDGDVTVAVRATSPSPGCAALTVITNPVDVVQLPRYNGHISFEQRSEIASCP